MNDINHHCQAHIGSSCLIQFESEDDQDEVEEEVKIVGIDSVNLILKLNKYKLHRGNDHMFDSKGVSHEPHLLYVSSMR